MRFFIALAVFVCRSWMVCGLSRCPFPGITAHAEFKNRSFNWQNRTSFQEGDVVKYVCRSVFWLLRRGLAYANYDLTCRSDGTWSNPLPRCSYGNLFGFL
jgi:Sushi repeat (SCR repeat)